jgi:hypothetical protein
MAKGIVYKIFVYFLCFSFMLLTGGFPKMLAEAKEGSLPIGEMISSGEVEYEARENVWKTVEPSHFPIFQGVKIKTGKGMALIVLENESHIEVGQNSLFSFQHNDQLHLSQGTISFRIPSGTEMTCRVEDLSIGKSPPLEAARSPLISPRSEETVGSIALHPNGAVTVKSIKGPLSVQNQDNVVLAALSSKESVTIPSITASGGERQMVAQVGDEYPTGEAVTEELLGLSKTTWFFIAVAAVAVVGGGIAYVFTTADDKDEFIGLPPVCP